MEKSGNKDLGSLSSLAKLVINEFKTLKNHSNSNCTDIEEMLINVIVLKNSELEVSKELNDLMKKQMLEIVEELYDVEEGHEEHKKHEDLDREVVFAMNVEIMKRLINEKNEKIEDLENLTKKYNYLLDKFRLMEGDNQKLSTELFQIKEQTNRSNCELNKEKANALYFETKYKKLQSCSNRLRTEFKKQLNHLRKDNESFKMNFQNLNKKLKMELALKVNELKIKYSSSIAELELVSSQKLDSMTNLFHEKVVESNELKNEMRDFVSEISRFENFPRKSDESVSSWISEFREFKKTQNDTGRNKVKRNLFGNMGNHELHSHFIEEKKRFLRRYSIETD